MLAIWKVPFLNTQGSLHKVGTDDCHMTSTYGQETNLNYNIVLRSREICLKSSALIVRYSQKMDMNFFCFENPSQLLITLEPLVWFGWGFQRCTSPNAHFNQIETWKCHSHVQLQTDFPRSHHIFGISLEKASLCLVQWFLR